MIRSIQARFKTASRAINLDKIVCYVIRHVSVGAEYAIKIPRPRGLLRVIIRAISNEQTLASESSKRMLQRTSMRYPRDIISFYCKAMLFLEDKLSI